jgi:hypothetical protein
MEMERKLTAILCADVHSFIQLAASSLANYPDYVNILIERDSSH